MDCKAEDLDCKVEDLTNGLRTDPNLNGRHLNMPDCLWDNLESVDLPSFRKTGQKGPRGRFGQFSPE